MVVVERQSLLIVANSSREISAIAPALFRSHVFVIKLLRSHPIASIPFRPSF
jgi:hypothetical protein